MSKALKNVPAVDKEKLAGLYSVPDKNKEDRDKEQEIREERLSIFYGAAPKKHERAPQKKAEEKEISKPIEIFSNFYKMDNAISDALAPTQTLAEQAVYNRLYRLSYGYQKKTCRVGMGKLAKSINVKSSEKTIKKAISGLIKKGHIKKYDTIKKGTLYKILLPSEIKGVKNTVVKNTTVKNTIVNNTTSTVVKNTTPCSKKYYSDPKFTDDKKNPKYILKDIYKDIIKEDDEIFVNFNKKTNKTMPKGVAQSLAIKYGRDSVFKHTLRLDWNSKIKNPVGFLIDSLENPDMYLALENQSVEEKQQEEEVSRQDQEKKEQNRIQDLKREQKRWDELKSRFSALPNDKKDVFMGKAKKELIKENSQLGEGILVKTVLREYNVEIRAIQIMAGETGRVE